MLNEYEFQKLLEDTVKNYRGDGSVLLSALGALVLGYFYGWRVLSLVTSEKTYRKYQNAIGVIFKDVMPERGRYAHKSIGLAVVDKFENFWRVVKGQDKMDVSEKTYIN